MNLLGGKQTRVGGSKMDCDAEGYKHEGYDETSNEVKSMQNKVGWKGFFAKVKYLITDLLNRLQTKASSKARHKPYCEEEMLKTTGMNQDPAANHRASCAQARPARRQHSAQINETSPSIKETVQRKKPMVRDEVNR